LRGSLGLHDVPVLGGAASILTLNQRVGNTHGFGQRHARGRHADRERQPLTEFVGEPVGQVVGEPLG
jgi:hypothetical protein